MLDFIKVSTRCPKRGITEVYPVFLIKKSKDLMIRGRDFYAIWDEERKLWSQDEYRAVELIDNEIQKQYDEIAQQSNGMDILIPKYLWNADSGMIDKWHKYVQKGLRDNYVPLDENIVFSDQETSRETYASVKLPYPLKGDDYSAWDELVSVLYAPTERHKIEWVIGSIASGASKNLQKFVVFYGSGGTGKSTILNIIDKMFEGYSTTFDAKALGNANSAFSLEPFACNPLVAIDHDSKLDRIEDNTRINSLVSHEKMVINEKHKSLYKQAFNCILLIGTNNPVKITDAKSGIIRRLIDVSPTGDLVPRKRYDKLMDDINYQLGGIVKRCMDVFNEDPNYYDEYVPVSMISSTNHFYDFVLEEYSTFSEADGITKAAAFDLYKRYCESSNISYPMDSMRFKNELMNYFEAFYDRKDIDGKYVRNWYEGFLKDKFKYDGPDKPKPEVSTDWIELRDDVESAFDLECHDCLAQYTTEDEKPKKKWAEVEKILDDIKTKRLHYVRVPLNHIVIDFDIKDPETGKKSLELNLKAANKFPPTYVEVSKGGQGLHLHYIYAGDPEKLERVYDKGIEVKVFTGNSSLRRKLTKCNAMPVATISSGLPLRKEKSVLDDNKIKSERQLRSQIIKCLNKEYDGLPGTKVNVEFIKKLLNDAKEQGLTFDLTDLRPDVFAFAANSTNHKEYCIKQMKNMVFKSLPDGEQIEDNIIPFPTDAPLVFYDVEVFPNLLVICWKRKGDKKVTKMINPSPDLVRKLYKMRLVGFNNRRYDNHIIFAAGEGYTNKELFDVSQSIINGKGGFFGQAYNISYTDIYDFSSAANKKSLKKWEIELGIHHQELGLPWDEEVPEDMWDTVADYCCNDVLATEAVWDHLQGDFAARDVLVDLANALCPEIVSTVNDTTNTLSTRIIFGNNKHPQDQFCYRDLSKPVKAIDPEVHNFLYNEVRAPFIRKAEGFKPYWKKDADTSILPYFPGYEYDPQEKQSTYRGEIASEGGRVFATPGIYFNVGLFDIQSMHPSSTEDECLFGPVYTRRFRAIKQARIYVKHEEWDELAQMLDGVFIPVIEKIKSGKVRAEDVNLALKTVINSVYGLTKAGFDNPFKDPRNVDNIVAKRGALFMIDLQKYVESLGFTVIHIKTDSIKVAIPEADDTIIRQIMDFGADYGYIFEHEATYEKFCLVNKAVYVAKDAKDGHWTATGDQFKEPYVFKTLFSHKDIENKDLIQVFNSKTGALYLDYNEYMGEDEHSYQFVGRTGAFVPIKPGRGGAELRVKRADSYFYPGGAKGYRWLEAEVVEQTGRWDDVDFDYYNHLVDEAIKAMQQYDDFDKMLEPAEEKENKEAA